MEVETEAPFWIVALHPRICVTVNTISTSLVSFRTRPKLLQRIFPPFWMQVGSLRKGLKVRPKGMGSAIVTLVAVAGPRFVTAMLYVSVPPRRIEEGPIFVMERSASFCCGHWTIVEITWLALLPTFSSFDAETVATFCT